MEMAASLIIALRRILVFVGLSTHNQQAECEFMCSFHFEPIVNGWVRFEDS